MFKIVKNTITLTRGDTAIIDLSIKDGKGNEYQFEPSDTVTFTVKKDAYTEDILIQKEFSDGVIRLNPQDTKELDYGVYKYDVQLKKSAIDIFTVIVPSDFILTEEVTW